MNVLKFILSEVFKTIAPIIWGLKVFVDFAKRSLRNPIAIFIGFQLIIFTPLFIVLTLAKKGTPVIMDYLHISLSVENLLVGLFIASAGSLRRMILMFTMVIPSLKALDYVYKAYPALYSVLNVRYAIYIPLALIAARYLYLSWKSFNKSNERQAITIDEIEEVSKTNPSKAGYMFEVFIANLFQDKYQKRTYTVNEYRDAGKMPKELVGVSGDGGVDVIMEDENTIFLIQTKYYKNKVNNDPINKLRGLRKFFVEKNPGKNIELWVVTNNLFTKAAVKQASNDVFLMDGPKMLEYFAA